MREKVVIFVSILLAIMVFFTVCATTMIVIDKEKVVQTATSTLNDYNTEKEKPINENIETNNIKKNENKKTTQTENKIINDKAKEETKNKKEEIYKAVDEKVYAITTVHIREKDDTKSTILATVNLGDVLQRVAVGSNGWSKIKYNNVVGYISTQYISKEKPPEKEKVDIKINTERKIDPSKPMVALTFDDGPNPNSTPRILDALEKNKCVATFFDLGTCMSKYPDITKREEAIGCEVGSHTYGHKNLDNLSKEQILEDIKNAEIVYKNTLGHDLTLVRPPYGNANSTVKLALNYPLINWDVDTEDWKSKNKDSIIDQVNKTENLDGRIILMHSIYNSTADAVEELIPQLLNEGYQLVTISELAKYKNIELKTHTAYWGFK